MPTALAIDEFLQVSTPILDVRSPGEYEQGHIPGAFNLPLFSNEERAQVGTCYKQYGRESAVEVGLALVGPKLIGFVQQAKAIAPDHQVRVHCWRGGMRSGSMAWLLETAGLSVVTLEGGYKSFRRWVRRSLATPKPIISLGGMTGTGKTTILKALAQHGEQMLDLEGIANHRGSSYGNLGLPPQPSTEHFENLVAIKWSALSGDRPVWIEAESRSIGTCRVPDELFQPMIAAPVVQIERSRDERIRNLLEDYGKIDPAGLVAATDRIRRKLGGLRTQEAIDAIHKGDLAIAADIILHYYDKTYTYDLNKKREVKIHIVDARGLSADDCAQRLIEMVRSHISPVLHQPV
ncbi:MAG: tRNA 2-selenouridine(34) synthase MnmH [Elainellaceae cyanobacterium]